ncbi:uncharacterized protein MICPUCDRAFT_69741 [Micromonas pusilla CCMP1545]|uniref:Predicted protein n=1 Tax=Micromonas pusilla (strain CCMP1545) TaxID=564608 RepID=C1MV33_MICPC|nr:uncharacterized protein MICPUCDRAFT_69741 [Micromonas pusilla CCMP1545]EEH56432.1 predicted protein [Micromonas pusilla CCMP1545]|eukprot:XP_003059300.1 predicted protein [Micromonas pusilla CCMP1545]
MVNNPATSRPEKDARGDARATNSRDRDGKRARGTIDRARASARRARVDRARAPRARTPAGGRIGFLARDRSTGNVFPVKKNRIDASGAHLLEAVEGRDGGDGLLGRHDDGRLDGDGGAEEGGGHGGHFNVRGACYGDT